MEVLVINGGQRLEGVVVVQGAKNAALPIMAATLLATGECRLQRVPRLQDVSVMAAVIRSLGMKVEHRGEELLVAPESTVTPEVPAELMRQLRASNLVMGPLLGRWHYFRVPYPGGCAIGSRPMDLHIKGLMAMGAEVTEKLGYIEARTTGLRGTSFYLDFPSVGATENLMMAAALAEGVTTLYNAAREPEIVDLQNFLNAMGARIRGAGRDTIRIEGVRELKGCDYKIIPDRIEAGTFLAAAAATGGDVLVQDCQPEHLMAVLAKLREMGARIIIKKEAIRIQGPGRPRAVDCKTLPYPGFPTDMQPQFMALMSVADGTSIMVESIFENRFKHAAELRRLGADIKIEGRVAVINGVPGLSGSMVEASDLRAGAALVIAGLLAEGQTLVEGVHHLDRGYEQLEKRLGDLGADIQRLNKK
ncbi:UDP-N-acetylglucosamine 1-carboxyvinyltransferase [Neomoorella thermoacetica]|uniref:UDP-N-acetylglucosamine 1-carboxyvinyltransferase n=2 Tax=Neomoorella thermoacetica TaxID=1525 RepID=A0A0S6UEC1_NEOTH|nr:UDP-N-acetylglucosamine 1-carboxyvinyltransferase [Moorella thermoacetica]AKX96243.1 UDP-N-acetylglucosamine 1-carboxyvinyltransferase 1 [Moorella thermoacetica]OIQ55456.1 UDP-N-acetylglucosamine 1-carboxyvinyltransferase 1 [Moorella thermoacetica]OIQ55707.1 UDP-N-acetylglucosamine 1-carboxyvinyltransferase 1 [Moorella thermoacetica]QDA00053.1 UDP-N-acetylglucosamine 1-carboxyvinyltransferase 1 [Moorella thermoacetica]TYL08044.1 UDP-N-acetylglucosamine 1-carboxyvinyltransferase 1 [Moorella 